MSNIQDAINNLAYEYIKNKDKNIRNNIIALVNNTLTKSIYYIAGYTNIYILKTRLCYDIDDIKQECLLILYNSLQTYKFNHNKSFYNYFYFNMRRRFHQLFIRSNAKKRICKIAYDAINNYDIQDSNFVTLDIKTESDEFSNKINLEISNHRDFIERNEIKGVILSVCNKKEKKVINEILNSKSNELNYSILAKKNNVSISSIHNILYKVADKTKKILVNDGVI